MIKWVVLIVALAVFIYVGQHLYKRHLRIYVKNHSVYYRAIRRKIDMLRPDVYRGQELMKSYIVELPFRDEAEYDMCDLDEAWHMYIRTHNEFLCHAYTRAERNARKLKSLARTVFDLNGVRISIKPWSWSSVYCHQMEDVLTAEAIQMFQDGVVTCFEVCVRKYLYAGGQTNTVREETFVFDWSKVCEALEQLNI